MRTTGGLMLAFGIAVVVGAHLVTIKAPLWQCFLIGMAIGFLGDRIGSRIDDARRPRADREAGVR